jgi:hypothetical protein
MKESESQALSILRNSTLNSLSKAEFEELEKAVEKDGILNLVGTARDTVRSAVLKYNMNHDGKGQFASGSGGGSSSDTSGQPATSLDGSSPEKFSHPNQKRSLSAIARDIHRDPAFKGSAKAYASPYTQAMASMHDIKDNYGADTGKSVVAYALANMGTYRGDTARAIKAEMKGMLK